MLRRFLGAFIGLTAWGALALASNSVGVSQLGWMTGTWRGFQNQQWMEEQFAAPAGGMLLGTSHFVKTGTTTFFEFVRFVEQDGTIVLYPMPNGTIGVPFKLKELTSQKAVFENPAHDFPRTITYQLTAGNQLISRVEGIQNNAAVVWEFRFQKSR